LSRLIFIVIFIKINLLFTLNEILRKDIKKAAGHLPPGYVRLLALVVVFFWSTQVLGAGKLTRQLRRFMDQDR
jgi:hypothetical protein